MAAINPRDIAVSFGAFLLVVATVGFIVAQVASNNPGSIDDEDLDAFQNTFNKLPEYGNATANLQSSTEDVIGEQGVFGFLNSLINQAWNSLRTLFSTFAFINLAISGLSSVFGIPTYVTGIAIAMITLVFVFGVLAVIFNRTI